MIDEVKWQELKDAAAHAKHNGGRVSVEWYVLDCLLEVYKSVTTLVYKSSPANVNASPTWPATPESPHVPIQEQLAQASEPAPPAEPPAVVLPEEAPLEPALATEPTGLPELEDIKPPEPTIQ